MWCWGDACFHYPWGSFIRWAYSVSNIWTLARITLFMESLLCIPYWAWPGKACAGPVTNNETPNRNRNDLVASSKMKQRNKIKQISNEQAWQMVLTGPVSAMPHAAHQTRFCWHKLYANIFLLLMLVLPVLILKASLKFVTQCWRLLCLLIVCVYACLFVRVRARSEQHLAPAWKRLH